MKRTEALILAISGVVLGALFALGLLVWSPSKPYYVHWSPSYSHDSDLRYHPIREPRPLQDVVSEMGQPLYDKTLPLNMVQDVWKYYPPDRPENKHVRIRELFWWRDNRRITVWFHKVNGEWISLMDIV